MTSCAPALAKPSAMARPRPREEPVTNAVLPERSKSEVDIGSTHVRESETGSTGRTPMHTLSRGLASPSDRQPVDGGDRGHDAADLGEPLETADQRIARMRAAADIVGKLVTMIWAERNPPVRLAFRLAAGLLLE